MNAKKAKKLRKQYIQKTDHGEREYSINWKQSYKTVVNTTLGSYRKAKKESK